MGASRLDIHQQKHLEIAEIAKVFAHPARVAIIEYISKSDACICTDISEHIGLSQPTTSQHLKVIRDAGLLQGEFQGKSVCYCLNAEKMEGIKSLFNSFFNQTKIDCCS
ncbi:ArsR/SmtB family transcription factor [Croceiramulus getboli]|nr:metalloregulator ArsR/SmtB family transcription factor [Flavobacteriaceae bacterium YJPT1-3]